VKAIKTKLKKRKKRKRKTIKKRRNQKDNKSATSQLLNKFHWRNLMQKPRPIKDLEF
jgi:hypothetical protein